MGGQLLLASAAPFKKDISRLVGYYEVQMAKANVEVTLGHELTASMVGDVAPDAVVLATGAEPLIPDIPGVEGENVVTANEVLMELVRVGDRVVVAGGGMAGCEVAALLAQAGKKTAIVEMQADVATDMPSSLRGFYLDLFAEHGVAVLTGARIDSIDARGAVVVRKDWTKELIVADTIVLALGARANTQLEHELKGRVEEVHVVGDCSKPRTILEAVADGARVGYQL